MFCFKTASLYSSSNDYCVAMKHTTCQQQKSKVHSSVNHFHSELQRRRTVPPTLPAMTNNKPKAKGQNAAFPFVQHFSPQPPTMPATATSSPPTDQFNCRSQQQQTTQMNSTIVLVLFFSHSHSLIAIFLFHFPSRSRSQIDSTTTATFTSLHSAPLINNFNQILSVQTSTSKLIS